MTRNMDVTLEEGSVIPSELYVTAPEWVNGHKWSCSEPRQGGNEFPSLGSIDVSASAHIFGS